MSGVRAKFDLTGRRFGRLVVTAFDHREHRPGITRLHWRCKCDCGNETVVLSGKLSGNRTTSCGCPKEGGSRTDWPGYTSLKAAIARCENKNHKAFKDYGGRGIAVCPRWRFGEDGKTGFECFFDDMGPRPSAKHSIDRIETNGNYEPGNCRWATKRTQQQNQRRAIYALVGGVRVPLSRYVERTGLCYETIRFKVKQKGMSVCDAARDYLARSAAPRGF